jgi:membrane protein YqaA with SNARE-associated domain
MQEESPKANYGLSDLLKASWMRSSIKLGVIATVVALVIIWLMKIFNVAATPMFSNISSFFATYGIIGVFIATIAAGTLLPLGSPALVVASSPFLNPVLLILVATFGFTIGMTINYGLAYKFGRPYIQKRVSAEHLEEITCVWSKWGWTIYTIFGLIPVLPVELLSFICGFLKTSLTIFLALSFLPRFIIFALLVYFGQYVGVWLGAF